MKETQIAVVGSGPGGAAIAWSLATAGAKVTILEAGPKYDPLKDYLLADRDWEQKHFPAKVSVTARQTHAPLQGLEDRWDDLRSWNHLSASTVKFPGRYFSGYHHVVGVGGTTLQYAGESHRLHPAAMKLYSRFGVGADWPFDYDELESFYVEAERAIGVAGPENDPSRPRSAAYPMRPHALSYASQTAARGFGTLGLTLLPNPVAINSQAYDGRPPCNYCGQCARGCPRFDKGTADVTLIAKALATGNCTLLSESPVLRLEAGKADRVTAAIYADATGAEQRLEADAFIVACGAIETPRLLLNSTGPGMPDGLANESGLVGRNLMETLFWISSGLHPEPLGSHRGLPTDAICWDYNAPNAVPDVVGGVRLGPMTIEADLAGPINYAKRVVGGWGKAHQKAMREQFGRVLSIGGIGENLPNPGSYVDLDPEEKDAHGQPKARIHSRLPEMELRRLRFIAKTSRQILEASGVEKRIEEYGTYDTFNSTHVFGTCRMGTDAETSVVDSYCRSHRWRNLLVTDASIFPSSGGGESPSLSIYANSLRAAHYLKQQGVS